ncbi:MAG TPA: CDP-alcohol phosphatidyltransferase family protein [Mesorhizobium sp.]|jgi:phosphatidylglycerophosphate synthase|nr:CDP-alcohol phosphatidyltransferase family protein [Mesorhizobium sp.]
MLDGWARRRIDPALDAMGAGLAARGVSADAVTFLAFGLGMAAAAAVWAGWFLLALALLLVSRLGDGLDGAVAKASRRTDRGGFLDIVLDFTFYSAVPLSFVLNDPVANGVGGAVLLFSFYVNGASFLAFAVLAAKRGLSSEARGKKSIVFTTGLAEATETILAFALMCLFPAWFSTIAYAFAVLTLYTALSRIVLAWRVLDGS